MSIQRNIWFSSCTIIEIHCCAISFYWSMRSHSMHIIFVCIFCDNQFHSIWFLSPFALLCSFVALRVLQLKLYRLIGGIKLIYLLAQFHCVDSETKCYQIRTFCKISYFKNLIRTIMNWVFVWCLFNLIFCYS